MIVDLDDLIYFEDDGPSEEGSFRMTDFIKRHKPYTVMTGDFHVDVPPRNPEALILFASYAASK